MYEIFADILKGYGLKTADVSRATGISMSTFTDWKKGRGTPKADKMKKIADYLKIDVLYLMTGEKKENELQTREEIKLLESFRTLNDTGKEKLLDYLSDLLDNPKYTGKKSLISDIG